MERFTLTNRYGLTIVGDIHIYVSKEQPDFGQTGLSQPAKPRLAIVQHGLGSFRKHKLIQAMTDAFVQNGHTVISFDATNSIGESGGRYEDATMQKHYEDLCDVIDWAKQQPWFNRASAIGTDNADSTKSGEGLILAGHSLGGYAVARYAEEHPDQVAALFPFATVVSGQLSIDAHHRFKPGKLESWKETGWDIRFSRSRPDAEMRLPWSHLQERLGHDLLPHARKLTMPVLMMVGSEDDSCPSDHQQMLFDLIPDQNKELHIIKGAPHTFREPEHLAEMSDILQEWIRTISKR